MRYSTSWPPHPPSFYRFPIQSWDIFSVDQIPIATAAHDVLLDLIAACRGPQDARVLALRLNGATQGDIADELGFTQGTVSRRLAGLMDRAHLEDLGRRLRDRSHAMAAPPTRQKPSGLRYAPHTRGHRGCWCGGAVA